MNRAHGMWNPEIDVVVLHEGDRTIVELAGLGGLVPETLARVPGIAYRDHVGHVVRTSSREILAAPIPFRGLTAPAPHGSSPACRPRT